MSKANFFLVGAAKAGTTSIARFLESAPGTYFSPIKEPCYFSPDINSETRAEFKRQVLVKLETYLDSGMPYSLHMHQVEKAEHYARLFEDAKDASVRGECSTFYMPSRVAAGLIYAYNPDALIMAVLRDPVSRIRSHYLMDVRIGLERRPLKDCIDEEIQFGDQASYSNCRMYLAQSNYATQIKRFAELFPLKQLLILNFENVISEPAIWLPKILTFVGLPADCLPANLSRENSSDAIPRFLMLDAILYRSGVKNILRHKLPSYLPEPFKDAVKRAYLGKRSNADIAVPDNWQHLPQIQSLRESYFNLAREYANTGG